MLKSFRKSISPTTTTTHQRFSDYYTTWITTLTTTHLPNLRLHMKSSPNPTLLSAHVQILHHHFLSYYQTLDQAATADVSQILFPTPHHRNPIELPFLWLGDLHPYSFTILLRSFLINQNQNDIVYHNHEENEEFNYDDEEFDDDDEEIEVGESCEFLKKQWPLMNAWKMQSRKLTARIDQIERGLRLMVPALMGRVRRAQAGFVEKVGSKRVTPAVAAAEMEEEMVGIVMDANRLRKDVISEIVSVTSVYQGALFLEGLAQFLVGIRDGKLLKEFKKCKSFIKS